MSDQVKGRRAYRDVDLLYKLILILRRHFGFWGSLESTKIARKEL
jgi:hypothetical protein